MFILEIFKYDFMIRAFLAGIITAVIAPMIGIFLVSRRYSFMADTLAHVSLAGVAVGYLTGTQPLLVAIIASVITALAVEHLREQQSGLGDATLALFLSGGLAVAAVLISITNNINVNLSSVLFGSIATVSTQDIGVIGILGLTVFFTIIFLFKQLMSISFDEELAVASGLNAHLINRIFVVLAALTVAISMRIVGTMLIGALMVVPTLAAFPLGLGFFKTMLASIAISLFATVVGLYLSFYLGLSSGGTIVLLALFVFLLTWAGKRFIAR